jgi:hypothetical protein
MLGWSIMARFGVHAELDNLERDAAGDRLGLFGHVNGSEAAFADDLKEFVAANGGTFGFGEGCGGEVGFRGEERDGGVQVVAGRVGHEQVAIYGDDEEWE